MSQYRVLGVPTEGELQGSDNVIWVDAYTRDDGTEVKGHWRSKPEGGESSTDEAANIEEKMTDAEENTSQTEIEKKLYPDEIAGVKRGKPKTFEEMTQQVVNPNYGNDEDLNEEYSKNCQSCTVAAELVIRGYDVEAVSYETPEAKELAKSNKTAYLNPQTGKECTPDIIYTNEVNCFDYLEKNVKQGERYELAYNTPTESGNNEYDKEHEYDGHVVLITRNRNDEIEYYDPQNGEYLKGKEVKKNVGYLVSI